MTAKYSFCRIRLFVEFDFDANVERRIQLGRQCGQDFSLYTEHFYVNKTSRALTTYFVTAPWLFDDLIDCNLSDVYAPVGNYCWL